MWAGIMQPIESLNEHESKHVWILSVFMGWKDDHFLPVHPDAPDSYAFGLRLGIFPHLYPAFLRPSNLGPEFHQQPPWFSSLQMTAMGLHAQYACKNSPHLCHLYLLFIYFSR